MRDLSASFLTAIDAEQVKIAELYTLTLSDGTIYRYTSHGADISWNSNTYTAIPIIREDAIFETNFESSGAAVTLSAIGLDIYNTLHVNILEQAKLTIKLVRWNATYAADEEFIVYDGWLDVNYDRRELKLSVRSICSMLTAQMPRYVYEEPCNWSLFDDNCGLSRASHGYSGTATSGTATTLVDSSRGSVYKVAFDAGDDTAPVEIGDTITGGDNGYTAVVVGITYLTASTGYIIYAELSNSNNFNDDEVLTGGGNTVTVNGTTAESTTFYQHGELEMTGGDCSGQRRQIILDSGGTITVIWPFPTAIVNGDTYTVYPGCDKSPATCMNHFHNEENFRGFLYVPGLEETIG